MSHLLPFGGTTETLQFSKFQIRRSDPCALHLRAGAYQEGSR